MKNLFKFALIFFVSLYLSCDFASAEYSVNLMWINRVCNYEQKFLYPSDNSESLKEEFLKPIFLWSKVSKGGVINVWYDGKMISKEAVDNTKFLVDDYLINNQQNSPIVLLDIRNIPRVNENFDVFGEKVPVYFRCDLLRFVIAEYLIEKGQFDYFIYADLDMEPEYLLDDQTKERLEKSGIIFAEFKSYYGFEIGFIMINAKNKNLLEALKWSIIELNIKRALNALSGNFFPSDTFEQFFLFYFKTTCPMEVLQQVVYNSCIPMFMYFLSLEGVLDFKIYIGSDFEKYEKDKHGLFVFGLKRVVPNVYFKVFEGPYFDQVGPLGEYIAKKKVKLPPSKVGSYKDPLFDVENPNHTRFAVNPTSFPHDNMSDW